jgi:tetratricopeptide (TPR) repeat protein
MKKHYGWFLGLLIVIGLVSCQAKAKDLALESDNAAGYIKRAEAYLVLLSEATEDNKWDLATTYKDKVFSDFDKAIELEPENVAIYNRRGDIYCGYRDDGSFVTLLYSVPQNERFAKGIDDYITVIKLQPDNFDMYIKRGRTYKEIGMLDEAIADFEKAQTVDPKRGEGYINIASVYRYSDDKKATEYYQKALKVNPNDEIAKTGIEAIEQEQIRQAEVAAAKAKADAEVAAAKVKEEALKLIEQLCDDMNNFSPAQWDQTWEGKEVTVAGYLRSYTEKNSIMTKDYEIIQRNVASFLLCKSTDFIFDSDMVQCVFSDTKTINKIADDIYNGRLKEGTMFTVKGTIRINNIRAYIPILFNCEIIE